MKNLLIVLCVIVATLLLSCKKEYICECTQTNIIWGDTTQSNFSTPFTAKNDKEARGECEVDATEHAMDMKVITKCRIKK